MINSVATLDILIVLKKVGRFLLLPDEVLLHFVNGIINNFLCLLCRGVDSAGYSFNILCGIMRRLLNLIGGALQELFCCNCSLIILIPHLCCLILHKYLCDFLLLCNLLPVTFILVQKQLVDSIFLVNQQLGAQLRLLRF